MKYERSESIAELVKALVAAQTVMGAAAKDKLNPHFGSRYADLASCLDACRKPLADNGLAMFQPSSASGPSVTVTTLLAHTSGEWISCDLTITAEKQTAQGLGSALSYARRYGLSSLIGLAADDDDGNEVSAGKPSSGSKKAQEDVATRKIAEMQKQPLTTKAKDFAALKAFAEMKELIGEKLYRSVLRSNGFEKSNEIADEAKARDVYKQMGAIRKIVAAAGHGELIPGINEEIFLELPDASVVACVREYKKKLEGLCGSEVAVDEFEKLRAKAESQWAFCNLLQMAVNKYAAQQGLG